MRREAGRIRLLAAGLNGTGASRPNKSPRRKPGDRDPPGADPVACAQGFYGDREQGQVENLPPRVAPYARNLKSPHPTRAAVTSKST